MKLLSLLFLVTQAANFQKPVVSIKYEGDGCPTKYAVRATTSPSKDDECDGQCMLSTCTILIDVDQAKNCGQKLDFEDLSKNSFDSLLRIIEGPSQGHTKNYPDSSNMNSITLQGTKCDRLLGQFADQYWQQKNFETSSSLEDPIDGCQIIIPVSTEGEALVQNGELFSPQLKTYLESLPWDNFSTKKHDQFTDKFCAQKASLKIVLRTKGGRYWLNNAQAKHNFEIKTYTAPDYYLGVFIPIGFIFGSSLVIRANE